MGKISNIFNLKSDLPVLIFVDGLVRNYEKVTDLFRG